MVSDRQNGFETVVAPDPSPYQQALFDAGRLLQEGDLQACVEMLMPFASSDSAAIDAFSALQELQQTALTDARPNSSSVTVLVEALKAQMPFPTVSAADIGQPGVREWLIPDWMPAHRAGVLHGSGGLGKSMLALNLCFALATGSEWLGIRVPDARQVPVLFASYEDEIDELARRLGWIQTANGQGRDVGLLHLLELVDEPPLWTAEGDYQMPAATPAHGRLLDTAAALGTKLIVIDSAAAAYMANENARSAVRSFIKSLDAWARHNNCAVLLIAHDNKLGGASGSTDWLNGARYGWHLTFNPCTAHSKRNGHYNPYLLNEKANYAPGGAQVWLKRNPRERSVLERADREACPGCESAEVVNTDDAA